MSEHYSTDAEVIALASQTYEPLGVHIWLTSRNTMFDGLRPIDLLKTGRRDEVLEVLRTLASGNYA